MKAAGPWCYVWSINRWLRWTGWRLYIGIGGADEPSRIGLTWYGWSFVGYEPARGRWRSWPPPAGEE